MEALLRKKLEKLKEALLSYKKVVIAYSGGVDSSFLLKCCVDFLGPDQTIAVTAVSPTYTRKELQTAQEIAQGLGVIHKIIHTSEVDDPNFKANPQNRCYYCKSELFSLLQSLAKKEKVSFVLDGTNADDLKDYRPGSLAKNELGVKSPLAEANFTKEEIRAASKELGLATWDAPQMSCLASRFAYGQEIRLEDLSRIEKAENYIRALGFKMVRLRHYKLADETLLARLEVEGEDVEKVASYKLQVTNKLKELGYNYITLDLEGYRTGSMNEGITGGKI
ncbi:MAG: ATP-dependent sacrificial sulfur transferase LarE [Candidatus Omnitrophota bacterium]|nr:ATP-dependent sacrificial sulfur transferase LarE [Candidatus Omnitrophota bacterium]